MNPSKSSLFALAGLILLVSLTFTYARRESAATATKQNWQPVRVENTPLPVSLQGTAAVAGTLDARQSGDWKVSLAGTPNVAVTGTPNINVANTPGVQAQQSGAWNVGITGTPSVSLAGTPSVSITGTPSVSLSGTPTVNVANFPASSGAPTAALFSVGANYSIQGFFKSGTCRVGEIRGSWIRCDAGALGGTWQNTVMVAHAMTIQ